MTKDYRYWYNRGWSYAHRETATLDYGDASGFPSAWYDGYMDYVTDRVKWQGPDGPRPRP
jgi:hypothetical protein